MGKYQNSPSLRKIICLANSWKLKERCIAGIDRETGQWIRPVCDSLYPKDGRIPDTVRLINCQEPKLLDILEIPLDNQGNDFGFEPENRSVLPGQWKRLGTAEVRDLYKYYRDFDYILHNCAKYVYPSFLNQLNPDCRHTLQLVRTKSFRISGHYNHWRGTVESTNGCYLDRAKITDPVLLKKLDLGHQPSNSCWVTVSLSLPWLPPDWEEGEAPCWKLIAGVIEV
jgi:hypothetical protein